jgi:hypothetical protein
MKSPRTSISPREATEALCAALDTLSFIRKQDIRIELSPTDRRIGLLVRVNVFGKTYTLACALHARVFPEGLDAALYDVHSAATALGCSALPVLIAEVLSPEAQARCRQNHIAYIDLLGNAHLDVGEIFVARRAVYPRPSTSRPQELPRTRSVVAQQPPLPQSSGFPC